MWSKKILNRKANCYKCKREVNIGEMYYTSMAGGACISCYYGDTGILTNEKQEDLRILGERKANKVR